MIKPSDPTQRVMADFHPALNNPAVALCSEVWTKIFRATLDTTSNIYTAKRCAGVSFRLSLPPLSTRKNISDHISCISYGMLLGAIKPDAGSKLLYAAQVALGALPKVAKKQKIEANPRPRKPKTSIDPTPPGISAQSQESK